MLKTLASLKISRAFLFKYSMCVGLGVVFSPLCLWDFKSLREAQLKENNSGAAPSFLKLVRQLQKLTWVPGVTEKMVSGDGEARVTLSSIPKQSEMPWGPCLSTLLRSICYLSSSSLGQGQPWGRQPLAGEGKIKQRSSFFSNIYEGSGQGLYTRQGDRTKTGPEGKAHIVWPHSPLWTLTAILRDPCLLTLPMKEYREYSMGWLVILFYYSTYPTGVRDKEKTVSALKEKKITPSSHIRFLFKGFIWLDSFSQPHQQWEWVWDRTSRFL